jgi:hypothetical protein
MTIKWDSGAFLEGLQKAMPSSMVMTPALQAAGQHAHRMFRIDTKPDEEHLSELRTVFDKEEADEILRLCKACFRFGFGVRSVEYYVDAAIADIKLGFSKDHVRYALYQTCMANPHDELVVGEVEEQFFK